MGLKLHDTLTALLETNDSWCVNIDRGLLNGVIVIDLKKAFDAIDHEIILKKLAKYGVDQDALKWFKSYQTNCVQRCNVNNDLRITLTIVLLKMTRHYTMPRQCLDGVPINQSNQSKSLGLIIDENLSLTFMKSLKKKVSSGTDALKRVRLFVSMHTAIKMYKDLLYIEPHFDYCSAVWDGLTQQLSEKLQKLQNRAIRVITNSSFDTSSRYLLNSLSWDNLSVRRAKQKANLMYNACINNLVPTYLCNLFATRTPNYYFRNAKKNLILSSHLW